MGSQFRPIGTFVPDRTMPSSAAMDATFLESDGSTESQHWTGPVLQVEPVGAGPPNSNRANWLEKCIK